MSHVKNAASYSRLVDICTGLGGKYNPVCQTLQLKAMRALLKEAQSSLQDVSLKKEAYHRILNMRSSEFDRLDVLSNRVIGTLEALQVPEATIEDARHYYRLIAGLRATPRLPIPSTESDEPTQNTQRGFSQLSYVPKQVTSSNWHKWCRSCPLMQAMSPNYRFRH